MSLHLVDGETHETLEAALAFIDECGQEPTGIPSRHLSDESSSDSYECCTSRYYQQTYRPEEIDGLWKDFTLQPSPRWCGGDGNCATPNSVGETIKTTRSRAKAGCAKRNRSRDRQRVEILQLRAEAEVLQQRVAALNSKQQKLTMVDGEGYGNSAVGMTQSAASPRQSHDLLFNVWKDLANKRRRLRKEAQDRNRQLRELYATQVTTIETLKRLLLLQEHTRVGELRSNHFETVYYTRSYFDGDDAAWLAMARLHEGMGQIYRDTDRALLASGLSAITAPFVQTNINPITDTAAYIEVLNCRIVPFDFKVVGEAFWHEITRSYVPNEVERRQSPQAGERRAISLTLTLEMEEDGDPLKIQSRFAGKRVITQYREVVVLSGQSQLVEALGAAVYGVHFQEKQWLELSELSPGVCLVKVCMGMSVDFDCELPTRHQFVDRMCEMLSKLKQQGFESVLQGVEQSLLLAK
ncbi:hypothetical protein PHYPSEUDO_010216 [Phytophthora pseudosyringae]|uniref:Uncharacterized protein n=1 Tax=Phytophthora pseudosyringae TaxID=221518 RepID=A0A8T1VAM0_9STRA|nr:hypothetical protein PHYPSEUDO_010216 [Phytophthora pseudosyringae]